MTRDESGFATAQWTVIMAFSLVILLWFVNGLLIQYQRVSARSAVADAARTAARSRGMDSGACQGEVQTTLERLVPAASKPGVFTNVTCTGTLKENPSSSAVTVSVQYDFRETSFLPKPFVWDSNGDVSVTVQTRLAK